MKQIDPMVDIKFSHTVLDTSAVATSGLPVTFAVISAVSLPWITGGPVVTYALSHFRELPVPESANSLAVYNLRTGNEIGLSANYCYMTRVILPLFITQIK